MLIDRYLPHADVTEIHELEVRAPPDVTYEAMRRADLRDPLIDALFALRELPNRVARRWRGEPALPAPESLDFAGLATPEMGWMILAEEPGTELVIGSVGHFWKRGYGWKTIRPEEFATFDEPGYAKLAISLAVGPAGPNASLLRYEARTATTDDVARKRFRRYWRLIQPGVAIVMHRALRRIEAEAERRQRVTA